MNNRKNYPENWVDVIRPQILARDKYTCQGCRVKHRSYLLIDKNNKAISIEKDEYIEYREAGLHAYRVYLQVAHKDNNPANNDEKNLISLCVRCHAKLDAEYKKTIRIGQKTQIAKDLGALNKL